MRTPDCLVDPVPELEAVFLVVVAEQIVDDLFFGNVVGGSDIEGLDVTGAQQLPGSALSNAAHHGAKVVQCHHIRIKPKASFVFMSCHCVFLHGFSFVDGRSTHKIQY